MGHDIIVVHTKDVRQVVKDGYYITEEYDADTYTFIEKKVQVSAPEELDYFSLKEFSVEETYISGNFSCFGEYWTIHQGHGLHTSVVLTQLTEALDKLKCEGVFEDVPCIPEGENAWTPSVHVLAFHLHKLKLIVEKYTDHVLLSDQVFRGVDPEAVRGE